MQITETLLYKDIFQNEEYCQDADCGVELLPVHADDVDCDIRNYAAQDAVRNAVSQRHHDEGDEGRDRF